MSGSAVAGFDPKHTFETFVVGPANRLAAAAARRAAESPGSSYNPLFLYSASGLGKSHILSAIAQHAISGDESREVFYQTLEGYLDDLTRSLGDGGERGGRDPYAGADILLLDDIQFLTGQAQAQEMLLRTLDALTTRGAQVVLASDRPPAEINGLDARLHSRFSGGLIVDIGLPDYETRVAIMRRKVEDRNAQLADGVAETLARHPFRNVRELQGALNRLLALQELEERLIQVEELPAALGSKFRELGDGPEPAGGAGAGAAGAEAGAEAEPEWRRALRQVVVAVEAAGYGADRLRRHLAPGAPEPPEWRALLTGYRRDIDRLREIREELEALGAPPSADDEVILSDPDRLKEGERLLIWARERRRPFAELPEGPVLSATGERFPSLARRAAQRAMAGDHPEYNPLYLHSPDPTLTRSFLEACGRTFLARAPGARVGLVSVPEFGEELIRALSDGVAGAWRDRWWSLDLLLVDRVEALEETERVQEEFFHLFEALKRKGARIFLAADRGAAELEGVEDRLISRFEGGLVLELGGEAPGVAEDPPGAPAEMPPGVPQGKSGARAKPAKSDGGGAVGEAGEAGAAETWSPTPERVVWHWPRIEDRIVEEEP
jgi:chromosomal replication initiator protein